MGHVISQIVKGSAEMKSQEIDKLLLESREVDRKIMKLLLLGGAESGKTTIAKQMRLMHMDGFGEEDFKFYRVIIQGNAADALQQLIDASIDFNVTLDAILEEDYLTFKEMYESEEFMNNRKIPEDVAKCMYNLWISPEIQEVYDRNAEFRLLECAKLYLDNILDITSPTYVPSNLHILFARFQTTGINEMMFGFESFTIKMVDVGGQRSEQRKWIHCFDGVKMVMFITALSGYNHGLTEEPETNTLEHNLEIFDRIMGSPYFENSSIILFLNKRDLFAERIVKHPLTICFPEYTGENTYEMAGNYIFMKFHALARGRTLYNHMTTATDTENVKLVFTSSMNEILCGNVSTSGMD